MRKFLSILITILVITNPVLADYKRILNDINSNIDALTNLGKRTIEFRYADSGLIVMEGEVVSEESSSRIEQAVMSVKGVSRVDNRLKIVPAIPEVYFTTKPSPSMLTDSEILENIKGAYKQSGEIDIQSVEVSVKEGIAYLNGSLPSFRAVDKTLSVTLMADGVRDVKSQLLVNGKAYKETIR